jgi:hypothetical protein
VASARPKSRMPTKIGLSKIARIFSSSVILVFFSKRFKIRVMMMSAILAITANTTVIKKACRYLLGAI